MYVINKPILIKHLRAMSTGLRYAAACPAPNHAECPAFQKLVKAAASGTIRKRQRTTLFEPSNNRVLRPKLDKDFFEVFDQKTLVNGSLSPKPKQDDRNNSCEYKKFGGLKIPKQ